MSFVSTRPGVARVITSCCLIKSAGAVIVRNGVHRHSENIVRHDLDVSLRDIYALDLTRLTFIIYKGFPDLRVEDTVRFKGTWERE